jgi:hypothetical protein
LIDPDIPADIPADTARFDYTDDADDISPALVQESIRIRPAAPFVRVQDALFVLDSFLDQCGGMPAYQAEITRIADYLREVAA